MILGQQLRRPTSLVRTKMTSQHTQAWLKRPCTARVAWSSADCKLSHLSPQIHSINPQQSLISAPEIDPAGVGSYGWAGSKLWGGGSQGMEWGRKGRVGDTALVFPYRQVSTSQSERINPILVGGVPAADVGLGVLAFASCCVILPLLLPPLHSNDLHLSILYNSLLWLLFCGLFSALILHCFFMSWWQRNIRNLQWIPPLSLWSLHLLRVKSKTYRSFNITHYFFTTANMWYSINIAVLPVGVYTAGIKEVETASVSARFSKVLHAARCQNTFLQETRVCNPSHTTIKIYYKPNPCFSPKLYSSCKV